MTGWGAQTQKPGGEVSIFSHRSPGSPPPPPNLLKARANLPFRVLVAQKTHPGPRRPQKQPAEGEASGDITLKNIRQIAATGVDYIAVGALTHSAPAINLSLEIRNVTP